MAGPLAASLARVTLPYRAEAGTAILAGLDQGRRHEADPDANRARAGFAAGSIVATTEAELAAALDLLRDAGGPASTKGLGSILSGVWSAFRRVFRRAERDRAPAIGLTESSVAVHLGAIEAVRSTGLGFGKRWVVDGAPCPRCVANAGAGLIDLEGVFPDGSTCPPAHPRCMCSLVFERITRR